MNWFDYGGWPGSIHFSPLAQIEKSDCANLTQARFYPVADAEARLDFNHVIVTGVMYVLGGTGAILDLNSATGETLWTHPIGADLMDRGMNYWQCKDGEDRRLVFSADSYLQEMDARTGVSISTFGAEGCVNFREGLGRDPKSIPQI